MAYDYFSGYDPNSLVKANPGKRFGEVASNEAMLGRSGLLSLIAGGGYAPGQKEQLLAAASRHAGAQGNLQSAILNERLAATPGARGTAFGDALQNQLYGNQQQAMANYLSAIDESGMQRQYDALSQIFGAENAADGRRSQEKMQKRAAIAQTVSAGAEAAGKAAVESAREFKKDIHPVSTKNLLKTIENMNVKRFRYKPEMNLGNGERIGVLADETPEEMKAGDKHVDLMSIVGALLGAVQELAKEKNG